MISKTNKNGEKKLLAAIMALAMVLVAGFVIIGSEESDAYTAQNESNVVVVGDDTVIESGKNYYVDTARELTVPQLGAETTILVASGITITIKVADGATLATSSNYLTLISVQKQTSIVTGGTIASSVQDADSAIQALVAGGDSLKYTARVYDSSSSSWTANATVSGSVKGAITGSANTVVAPNGSLTGSTITTINYGVKAGSTGKVTYYPVGATVSKIELLTTGDQAVVTNGTVDIQQGSTIVKMSAAVSSGGITVTFVDGGIPTIGGTVSAGTVTVASGTFGYTAFTTSDTGVINGVFSQYINDRGTVTTDDDVTVKIVSNNVIASFAGFNTTSIQVSGSVKQVLSIDPSSSTSIGLASGSLFTISLGVTLGENVGIVSTNGTVIALGNVMGTVSGTGNVKIGPEAYIGTLTSSGTNTNMITGTDSMVSGALKGTASDDYLLADDSTIPAGETYTIQKLFGLNGHTLTVNGTLIISEGAEVFDTSKGYIVIGTNGSIVIDGVLAKAMPITISADASNKATKNVKVSGIDGVSFSIVGGKLAVSGDVVAIPGAAKSAITFTGDPVITGDLNVGVGVTITGVAAGTTLKDRSTLTVDGVLGGKIVADGRATIVVNGSMVKGAVIQTKTGSAGTHSITVNGHASDTTKDGSITGFVIEVTSKVEMIVDTLTTIYTPHVSGDIQFVKVGAATSSVITIADNFTVSDGSVLNISKDVAATISNTVTVDGLVSVVGSSSFGTYVGASYTKTVSTVTTYYYTTLESALDQIGSVDSKTVSTNVAEISIPITLEDKQILSITGNPAITTKSIVTVKSGATISGAIASVSGKLVVEAGATVTAPASYDAKYVDGTSTVYAGLAIAIKESDGSKPIQVVDSTVRGDLLVDAGKTVQISGQLNIEGDLVVEAGATLVGGTILVQGDAEEKAVAEIYGTVDVSAGILTTTNAGITVYGTVISGSQIPGINAAVYQDTKYYYTNIASAVESGKNVTVLGEYSESGSVTLAEEQILTIDGSADVTINEIVLSAGASVTSTGKLVAVITTGEGSVDIDGKVVIISIAATEEDEAYTSITNFDGALDVLEGTISINGNVSLVKGAVEIETGATLIVSKNYTLEVDADTIVTIDGKLAIDGTFTATSKDIEVSGELAIGKDSTVKSLEVSGVVTVADGRKLTVSENVVVGSYENTGANGTIVGKLVLSNEKTVKAYAGSDLENAILPAKKTTFFVNGAEFVTIYTNANDVAIQDAITQEDLAQIPGVVVPATDDINWMKENGTSINSTSVKVGDVPILKTTLVAETVTASVYVQAGIELHLGYGFYYSEGKAKLSIGLNDAYGVSDDSKTVIVKVFVNGIEIPVVDNKVDITADMIGQDVVVQASYGTTPGPTPEPTEPSEDILVSVVSDGTGVKVYLVSLDGGYIAPGKVSVKYYYTIVSPEYGPIGLDDTVEVDVLEADISADGRTAVVTVDLSEQTGYSGITSVEAAFGDFTSAKIVYTPVAVI